MTEKKRSLTAGKLKNFLVTGIIDTDDEFEEPDQSPENIRDDDHPEQKETIAEEIVADKPLKTRFIRNTDDRSVAGYNTEMIDSVPDRSENQLMEQPVRIDDLKNEIADLKAAISSLTSELENYAVSKEQLREFSASADKRDSELSNRKFMNILEQLSAMREDFFKLCKGIGAKADDFTPRSVLSSFEAYCVDMENILSDSGVYIGPFEYDKLNTVHQRIVDVIPTDDESLNGMIAERMSDGYEYNGRVLQKEKVKIYKFSEKETETNRRD